MRNYKMMLSYDGTRYKGWQRLGKGELTIQSTVEEAVFQVLGQAVEIHGSGRTDAGVHAGGQVANMKIPFLLKEDFVENMNKTLPEDIRVIKVERVPGNFHARYSAAAKTYRYFVDTREKASVFERKYVYHFPKELNLQAMREAAGYLTGTHDFSSFTDDKTERKKVRTIYEIQISEENGKVAFRYYGDGFLQHMVRIFTGTLLNVGCGETRPEEIKDILEKRERATAGFMVPAKGLFLENVDYQTGD